MPDGTAENNNLIDGLTVQIAASVNPAIKSIDTLQTKLNLLSGSLAHFSDGGKYRTALDNLASGFERIGRMVDSLDTAKMSEVGKSISSISRAFNGVSKASAGFEKALGGVEQRPKTISDVVGEELTPILDRFGITGEKDVRMVTDAFVKLGESVSRGVWDDDLEEKFGDAESALRSFATVAKDTQETYAGLLDFIQRQSAKSIHLPNEVLQEFPDNGWLGKAKTAGGNIFTTGPGTDFSAFLSELNYELGNIIPVTGNAANDFNTLAEAMRIARDEADELKNGTGRVAISAQEAGDVTYQAMTKIQEGIKALGNGEMIQTVVSPFNDMKEALMGLADIHVPDFTNLNGLAKSVDKLGSDNASATATNLPQISSALKTLDGISIPDFSNLSTLSRTVDKLGGEKAQNATWVLPNVMAELESFSTHFNGLEINGNSITTIQQLGSAFSKLGGKNATEAITNLPQLSAAIHDLVADLNNLPQVSEKTRELVVALGNLAKNHTSVSKEVGKLKNGFSVLGTIMDKLSGKMKAFGSYMVSSWKNTNALKSALDHITSGTKSAFDATSSSVANFSKNIASAKTHTESLVSVIIKARTIIWALKRAFSMFSESIELASNLVEVQNVIDNVFTENYADKIEDMSKSVIESLGMSELSFKQYASRYQAMGKAMGITNSQMMAAQDNLKGMGVAYGEANGNMQDMSVNLTSLAADLASFYDISQETAYTKLQAIYTGQTRPLKLAA